MKPLENITDEEAIESMKDVICVLQKVKLCPYVEHKKCPGTCNWIEEYKRRKANISGPTPGVPPNEEERKRYNDNDIF